ncbi:MAG: Calx-beta domain-containing protein [Pseudohongiellaceae bacterium]
MRAVSVLAALALLAGFAVPAQVQAQVVLSFFTDKPTPNEGSSIEIDYTRDSGTDSNSDLELTFTVTGNLHFIHPSLSSGTFDTAAAVGFSANASSSDVGIRNGFADGMFNGPNRVTVNVALKTGCCTTSDGTAYTIAAGMSTVVFNFVDDTPAPILSISDTQVAEDEGVMLFDVALPANAAFEVTADWQTLSSSTASASADYTAVTGGKLVIPVGSSEAILTVAITDDTEAEGEETVIIQLSNLVSARFAAGGGTTTATGTIDASDNTPELTASVAPTSATTVVGDDILFRINASPAPRMDLTLSVTIADATGDFLATGAPTEVVLPMGDRVATVTVATKNSSTTDSGTITMTVGADSNTAMPAYTLGTSATATATVIQPRAFIGGVGSSSTWQASHTVTEGAGVNFTTSIWLEPAPPAGANLTVTYEYVDGTAEFGEDYGVPGGSSSGTITFPTTESPTNRFTLTVPIINDDVEKATRNFSINLTDPVAPVMLRAGQTTTAVNIGDDDAPVISIADATVREDGGMMDFTVSLSRASGVDLDIEVDYVTSDGTAMAGDGTAMMPGDYTAITVSTLTIPAGDTTATISVDIEYDTDNESNETFTLVLSNPMNATLDANAATATGTIVHYNGPTLSIAASESSIEEGETVVFTITGDRALATALTVMVGQSSGAAVGPLPTTVTLPANANSVAFTVTTDANEPGGNIVATIARGSGYRLSDPPSSATVRVLNMPELTIRGGGTIREGEAALFTISTGNSGSRAADMSVVVETAYTGNVIPLDSMGMPALPTLLTVTVEANQVAFVIVVPTAIDLVDTSGGSISMTLMSVSADSDFTLGTPRTAEVSVTDGENALQQVNAVILPYVALAVSTEAVSGIQGRIESAFNGGGGSSGGSTSSLSLQGSSVMQYLAGQAQHRDDARGQGKRPAPLHIPRDISFNIALGGGDGGGSVNSFADAGGGAASGSGGSLISLWGHTFQRNITAGKNALGEGNNFEGDVQGVMVGIDTLRDNLVWGVGLIEASSEIDFAVDGFTGVHETSMTGLHPYIGYRWDNGIELWGSVGFGRGRVATIENDRPFRYSLDVDSRSYAAGGYSPLVSNVSSSSGVSTTLGVIGNAMVMSMEEDAGNTVDLDGGQVRLGLELKHERPLESDNSMSGSLNMVYRRDFGDGPTGGGVEVGGDLGLVMPDNGLMLDFAARTLLNHNDSIEEWGVSLGVVWAANRDSRGLSLSFKPQWGITGSRAQQLWNTQQMNQFGLGGGMDNLAGIYGLELKYGIPVMYGKELVELFARGDVSNSDSMALGASFTLRESLSMGYEAVLGQGGRFGAGFGSQTNRDSNQLPLASSGFLSNLQPGTAGYQYLMQSNGADGRGFQLPGGSQGKVDHRAYIRYHKRF